MNDRAPIFLHGILFRSGTNYLARLLELHPDCALSSLPEDWLLADSDRLTRYVDAVSERWNWDPAWNIEPDAGEHLVRHLGDALVSFLHARSEEAHGKRLVTKTPGVQALPNFFRLFPNAHLLILIRDGRSVVESSARSFGYPPNQVTSWWTHAAGQIVDFDCTHRGSGLPYRLVRYEELTRDPRREMGKILRFLDLDPQAYDFSQIESLPVFGSSTTRSASGEWEWKISPGSGDLGSLERWSDWSRGQHERFNWTAGERLEELGYQAKRSSDHQLLWLCAKLWWLVKDLLRSARALVLTGSLRLVKRMEPVERTWSQ